MAQFALPTSDTFVLGWAEGAGDGDANHWDELDEGFGAGRGSGSGPDDATTYWVNTGTKGSPFPLRNGLSSVTDPVGNTGHFIRSDCRKSASGGRQIDLTIKLYDPSTERAAETFVNVDDVWTAQTHTLTTGEADSIGAYGSLRMETYGTEVGGGGPRNPECSAHEFECPDAPGGGGGFAHSQGVIVG